MEFFFDDVIENPSYYSIIYTSSACEDIKNYATYVMGDAKSDISSGGVTLEFDETFDEAYSKDYKKKLKKVRKYIKKINGQDKDMDILVYFKYSDNILIYLGNDKFTVTKRSSEYFEGNQGQDIMTGEYMRMYSSLDEYLKDNR